MQRTLRQAPSFKLAVRRKETADFADFTDFKKNKEECRLPSSLKLRRDRSAMLILLKVLNVRRAAGMLSAEFNFIESFF